MEEGRSGRDEWDEWVHAYCGGMCKGGMWQDGALTIVVHGGVLLRCAMGHLIAAGKSCARWRWQALRYCNGVGAAGGRGGRVGRPRALALDRGLSERESRCSQRCVRNVLLPQPWRAFDLCVSTGAVASSCRWRQAGARRNPPAICLHRGMGLHTCTPTCNAGACCVAALLGSFCTLTVGAHPSTSRQPLCRLGTACCRGLVAGPGRAGWCRCPLRRHARQARPMRYALAMELWLPTRTHHGLRAASRRSRQVMVMVRGGRRCPWRVGVPHTDACPRCARDSEGVPFMLS